MNYVICFGACTDESNVSNLRQHCWMLNDFMPFSDAILSCKENQLLLINFRPEDERLLVENNIQTVSLYTLFTFVYGEPADYICLSEILRKKYRISIGTNQSDCVGKLLSYKSIARKISAFITDCVDIIKAKHIEQAFLTELRLVPVLWQMQGRGYRVDAKCMNDILNNLTMQSDNISTIFHKYYGMHFLNYYGNNLQAIVLREEILKLDSKIRTISKIENGYASTHFNSIGTRTFRITTTDSNIQGFPREIRKCLLPRIGDRLVEYDLTSSQFIILACLADEKGLISKYVKGEDLYKICANIIFGTPINEITEEERDVIKMAILQFINGAGGNQLQKEFGKIIPYISAYKSSCMMETLLDTFPKIRAYIKRTRQIKNYILPNGREIVTEEANSMLAYILQGIESDVLKNTLISIYSSFRDIKGAELYLCIHDAIFIDEKDYCSGTVRFIVEDCFRKAMRRYFPQLDNIQLKEKRYD